MELRYPASLSAEELIKLFSDSDYLLIALLRGRGVDVVARQHQGRQTDYRQAQRWGPDDYLVAWSKPAQRPDWLEPEL